MTQLACPTREQLTQFDSGLLSDDQAPLIGEHLDECATCRSLIQTVNNLDDTLASALHRPLAEDTYLDESCLRRAEALIQAIGREPSFAALQVAPAEAAEQSPSGRSGLGRIGPYQLLEELGKGGMGTVYKALHTQLDKVVAVKVLPADKLRDAAAVNRFHQEMKAVGRLEHRHIVRATDAGEVDGVHFLVMEYVDGIDLSQLVRRLGPLSIADACELARQAALGLQYAHQQHLVHRDIKPANLMLTDAASRAPSGAGYSPEPVVKVLDLGLARLRAEQGAAEIPDAEPLTATGQLMGTLEYMAPEQGADTHSVDIRADIYSLGATLFKLLTGTAPFPVAEYGSPMKMLTALATQPAPSIQTRRDDLPPELVDVIDKMLARDPADRFATPAEVAEALLPFAVGADPAQLLVEFNEVSAIVLVPPAVSTSSVVDRGDTAVKTEGTSPPARELGTSPSARELRTSRSARELGYPGEPPGLSRWSSRRNKRLLAIAVLLAGIMVIAGITLFLPTKNGVIRIEINDPTVQVTIDNGSVTITQKNSKQPITLTPGKHTLSIKQGDLTFETDTFTLRKGDKLLLRVERLPGKIQVVAGDKVLGSRPLTRPGSLGAEPRKGPGPWKPTPDQQAFLTAVGKLTPKDQLIAVVDRLKRANPKYDGKLEPEITGGKVTGLKISSPQVEDIWPLAALSRLRVLDCRGTGVADLSPLAGMSLTSLNCDNTYVSDLSPLEGMPLKVLTASVTAYNEPAIKVLKSLAQLKTINGVTLTEFLDRRARVAHLRKTAAALPVPRRLERVVELLKEFNPGYDGQNITHRVERGRVVKLAIKSDHVTDISPVRGLTGLKELSCDETHVSDLSPLKGMKKLTVLSCGSTRVSDLSPLKGMPLTVLSCGVTRISDLSPLKGMPLTVLYCNATRVSDLSPLKGMPLTILLCNGTRVSDFSPLAGMPLVIIYFSHISPENLQVLRGIKTLKTINAKPAAVFWKGVGQPAGSHRPLAEVAWQPTAEQRVFLTAVAKLKLEERIKAVVERLKRINPRYDGKLTPKITDGKVTGMTISNPLVVKIWPLAAFPALRRLDCTGTGVINISPLTGLPLEELAVPITAYNEPALRVLKSFDQLKTINGVALAVWQERRSRVEQLIETAAAFPVDKQLERVLELLKEFNPGSEVRDVGHKIENGRVVYLRIFGGTDISPVHALSDLHILICSSRVTDLSPLKGLPLTKLQVELQGGDTSLGDLSPLKGMPLTSLSINGTAVSDLTPLTGMPLTSFGCTFSRLVSDLSPLKGMKLTSLSIETAPVTDFSPLAGMPLTRLVANNVPVTDLSPLKGMPLKYLILSGGGRLVDLSPLQGMPLETLGIAGTRVTDLSPLKGMPLTKLSFDQSMPENLRLVRGIKTLKTINNKPAAVFWKEMDAKKTGEKK